MADAAPQAEDSAPIDPHAQRRARLRLIIPALLVLCAGIVIWRFTPIAQWATPDRLLGTLEVLRNSPWSAPVMVLVFVVGGLVFFPLTVLVAVSAILFPPLIAFGIAFAGTLANAVVTYGVGARLLKNTAREAMGSTVKKLAGVLENKGIVAVAIIRNIPLAPFTAVNLAAGLLGVRLRDYIIGTALGVAPGIAAFTMFGSQLKKVLSNPTPKSVGLLVLILLSWIGLSLLLQRFASRWRRGAK